MTIVNRIRYRGWLAPGIVLNAIAEGDVIFIPNNSQDGSLFSPSVARSQAVQLVGKICSVCWMIPLKNYGYVVDDGESESRFAGFERLDPFADPCVLAAPCLFDGVIQVVTGSDVARVEFETPIFTRQYGGKFAVSVPILPAVYIPNNVGTSLLIGISSSAEGVMDELSQTWNYTPVMMPSDAPAAEFYGSSTVAPFVGLQRYGLNLAGLYTISHGNPTSTTGRITDYYLRAKLRHEYDSGEWTAEAALISLRSQATFVISRTNPYPRQLERVFNFFRSTIRGSETIFRSYLIPGSRQGAQAESDLESVLNLV